MNRRLGILTPLLAGTLAWAQGRPAQAKTGEEATATRIGNDIVTDVCKLTDVCNKVYLPDERSGPGARSRLELELIIAGLALLQKYYPLTITAAIDEARFKAQQAKRPATK